MPTSDLSLALMSSIPFSRPETFLDLGPDPWAPPGSTRLRRFYTRPARVHGAERHDEDDHTPLTKGTGFLLLNSGRFRPAGAVRVLGPRRRCI